MISLAFPWALLALPLPFLVVKLFPPHREKTPALRVPFFRRVVSAADSEAAAGAVILRRTRVQMVAAVLVWGLLVLAIAQPERLGAPVTVEKSARDVVLALDISGSMDEVDFETPDGEKVQRLAAVQDVVEEFIAAREGDRIGLIVFGSRAFLQAPLTDDLKTISDLVAQTEVGMAGPHTVIGDAIGLAIRTFETSDVEQRLLILLSDGSDTASSMSPINAAEIANSRGVEIHTIGVGDPDAQGENRVDLATLDEIATRTGGNSYFASDQEALTEVYARIDELAPRLVERQTHRPRQALAGYALALAALIGLATLLYLIVAKTNGRRKARANA
ncbi:MULTISPECIES: VWA domain-containing protein [Halocynthiibacter]|uniref:VWA domain-containing protein n=1 Tax=Halocynthiibacter halioticoli TaxID=2986804 RepID=A0AAE3LRF7_9RHOB|nr:MULTISPECIES: VWA domain-containing protein [Halocynthiibacter]MCV6824518.1 VWA domain-containing protein [Halocynthiibacter halioticoli]MCW4057519.1 VWA domain-containing protein [Halocynthiibacter sp. SDUM655004]